MATFDQLSAEQRAIVELILKQGKTYDELSGLLGMDESRVRELARDALISLAPVSVERVEEDWRGQLADYVLAQQSGPEATATRGHLRRSEASRTWTRSLLDALETFYPGGDMPTVPEGERGRARERGKRERPEAAPAPEESTEAKERDLSPGAKAAVRRRRLVGGLAALAVLALLAVLVWPVGVLTGGDDEPEQAATPGTPAAQGRGNEPAGIAIVAERDGQKQVVVQAANLAPNKTREAYEVWLYNSPGDAKSLGAQTTDQRGTYQGAGPLPSDYQRYKFIDVSQEPIDRNQKHSGQSVLRGQIGKLEQPANAKKGQPAVLGQIVLAPPAG